jgi:hypothetical protein
MLSEPEIGFVPEAPPPAVNPHAVWEGLLVPPVPTPEELKARPLRNGGVGLFVLGTVLMVVAIPTLAGAQDAPVARGVGYAALSASLLSFGAGGALFGVGDRRIKLARRRAAGLSH